MPDRTGPRPQPRKNAPKTRGKPFEPGNPGRPKGARHRITLAIEALLEGDHEKLTRKAIELALAGDTTALRLCLERLAPIRRDAPVAVDLPRLESAHDIATASAALISSAAAGDITPDEASRIMGLLSAHRAIVETSELADRISALETARPTSRR